MTLETIFLKKDKTENRVFHLMKCKAGDRILSKKFSPKFSSESFRTEAYFYARNQSYVLIIWINYRHSLRLVDVQTIAPEARRLFRLGAIRERSVAEFAMFRPPLALQTQHDSHK